MRALIAATSTPWAILTGALQTILEIANGERVDLNNVARWKGIEVEAVEAQLGRPVDGTQSVTIRDGIATIPVEGPLFRYANLFTAFSGATSIELLSRDFNAALNNPMVDGIVLAINSPGGEVDGTSEFAEMVYAARGTKPITAYVSHLGASAAYWIASAADEIVVNDTALVGSIGVVMAMRDPSKQLVRDIEFVSTQSPNKRPDPTTERGRAQIQALVDGLGDVFVTTVARNRGVDAKTVIEDYGQGGMMVGKAAVDAGLADRVGAYEAVLAEMQQQRRNTRYGMTRAVASTTAQEESMDWKAFWGGLFGAAQDAGMPVVASEEAPESAPAPSPAPVTREADPALKAENERLRAENEQLRAEREREAAALQSEREARAKAEAAAQQARFEALIANGGTPWVGEAKGHLAVLVALGEGTEAFSTYVAQQNAVAAQLSTSKLLEEVGSDSGGTGSSVSAWAQIEAKAKALSTEKGIGMAEAIEQIASQDAPLYRQYLAERKSR